MLSFSEKREIMAQQRLQCYKDLPRFFGRLSCLSYLINRFYSDQNCSRHGFYTLLSVVRASPPAAVSTEFGSFPGTTFADLKNLPQDQRGATSQVSVSGVPSGGWELKILVVSYHVALRIVFFGGFWEVYQVIALLWWSECWDNVPLELSDFSFILLVDFWFLGFVLFSNALGLISILACIIIAAVCNQLKLLYFLTFVIVGLKRAPFFKVEVVLEVLDLDELLLFLHDWCEEVLDLHRFLDFLHVFDFNIMLF